jgi:hypothetical protein
MWKKMVMVAGLLCFLVTGLAAAEPARADMPGGCIVIPPEVVKEMIKVTIWGRLQEVIPPKEFPDGREIYCPDHANRYLAVVVNGRKYKLDFGSKLALWQQAEKLRDQRVIVEGELQGDRVVVTGLAVDPTDCAKEKIAVEIRGKLEIVHESPKGPGPHVMMLKVHLSVWANGREFQLDLRDTDLDLWEVEKQYRGQTVLVTGTLEDNKVRVKAVKADGEYILKTVTVEIKGKLQCLLVHWQTGEFHSAHDNWDAPQSRSERKILGIVIDGKVYRLQGDPKVPPPSANWFEDANSKLCGRTVTVTGTLVGETVTVGSIKAVDTPSIQETVIVEIKGTLSCIEVAPAIYPCPEHMISRMWTIHAEGKSYSVNFGSNKKLEDQARQLQSGKVVIRGTLKDGVVTVTSLEKA